MLTFVFPTKKLKGCSEKPFKHCKIRANNRDSVTDKESCKHVAENPESIENKGKLSHILLLRETGALSQSLQKMFKKQVDFEFIVKTHEKQQ